MVIIFAARVVRPPDIEEHPMAKRTDLRPVVTLRSMAGTGFSYVTTKNRRTQPDRLVLRKFDPVAREHVDFRETR
jgi:large subunit ribosomal protein L33